MDRSLETPRGATVVPSIAPQDLIIGPTSTGPAPARYLTRLSWGGIIAGAAVACTLQVWFNLLGLGIGLAAFEPGRRDGWAYAIGSAVWLLAGTTLSLFSGGWLAGRFSRGVRRSDGAIHGAVAWSIATIFGLFVLSAGVGRALGGAGAIASHARAGAPLEDRYQGGTLGQEDPLARPESDAITMGSEDAAHAMSAVALLGVLAMSVGLGAAALGGAVASPWRTDTLAPAVITSR